MSNITSGTFYMDNGFSVTVTNFNALTSRAMTTMDVSSATSFDRTFQIGQKATDTISLTFQGLTTANLNLAGTSISTRNNAIAVFPVISAAVNTINLQIAQFGGKRAQLEVASRNLDLSIQNQSLAKATFTDTDIPSALMELQKNKGLYDASTAMLQNTVHKYNELADLILRTTR
jgi:flagellin